MGAGLHLTWIGLYGRALLNGVVTTVGLIAVTTLLGGVASVIGAAARRSNLIWCRALAIGYVELIRNTPFIVQLFFVFLGSLVWAYG